MAALSTAANVFGVITPVKDVIEVVRSISTLFDEVSKIHCNVSILKSAELYR